jgi:hypothetical protein
LTPVRPKLNTHIDKHSRLSAGTLNMTAYSDSVDQSLDILSAALQMARNESVELATLDAWIAQAPRPFFPDPSEARTMLWAILAEPGRANGLSWLTKHRILDELLPVWSGNMVRQKFRLQAMDQVHLETWNVGLDAAILRMICDTHDVVIDRRLNRWALTALATLLAGGDIEDPRTWAGFVRRDLHALGATEAEIVWVTGILLNFNQTMMFLRGELSEFPLRPECALAGLSTLSLTDPKLMAAAVGRVNAALEDAVNPLDRVPEEEDY